MEKASRAIRRSSAKLMSFGTGNADLSVLMSEVKDIRSSAKSFMAAQNLASNDMLRWAANEENRAIQDVVNQAAELSTQWTDVQRDFIYHLKEYRQMFEMIMEGEKHVSQAKQNLALCEQKEVKIRKELKKAARRASAPEISMLEGRLSQAERAREVAEVEVSERIRENEAVKMIRMKEGLLRMSEAYMELGNKCAMIFEAQRDVAFQLPDVHGKELEQVKYSGAAASQLYVKQAKENVKKYKRKSHRLDKVPLSDFERPGYSRPSCEEPPPPYYPSDEFLNQTEISDESSAYSPSTETEIQRPGHRRSYPMTSPRQLTDPEEELSSSMGASKLS
ncbi:uncharacterized protein LOC132544869 [Ylistrum balloti]|uniref:uncharacterized protein LOC132544869 n=1 Tax=Ylistrum balloti TaxID=509963 RepID=UPI002905838A|nr:uncharacterized protein LOC132544869 [Ylistrum balloti]